MTNFRNQPCAAHFYLALELSRAFIEENLKDSLGNKINMAAEFLSEEFKRGSAGFCPARLKRISPWLKRYVDEKTTICPCSGFRKGQLAYSDFMGLGTLKQVLPLEDGIYRIYSMTKLVTTVAALALYEKGAFQLDDPVDKFVDEFKDARVFISGRKSRSIV